MACCQTETEEHWQYQSERFKSYANMCSKPFYDTLKNENNQPNATTVIIHLRSIDNIKVGFIWSQLCSNEMAVFTPLLKRMIMIIIITNIFTISIIRWFPLVCPSLPPFWSKLLQLKSGGLLASWWFYHDLFMIAMIKILLWLRWSRLW